jgi:hypothetical protein
MMTATCDLSISMTRSQFVHVQNESAPWISGKLFSNVWRPIERHESPEALDRQETLEVMLASENALRKDWDSEEDKVWDSL